MMMQSNWMDEQDQEMLTKDIKQAEDQKQDSGLIRAHVLVAEDGLFVIVTEQGTLNCKIAASCLLRPEPGDLALVAMPEDRNGQAYILAVLERANSDSAMQINLGSGANMVAENGAVYIAGKTDLNLQAGGELNASAKSMSFVCSSVHWLSKTFSLLGKTVETICSVWRETSQERETNAQNWTQRLGDCHRHVQDLDETQAGTSRTLARDTALVHGRVTYVQAEEFVKADGEEVHLG